MEQTTREPQSNPAPFFMLFFSRPDQDAPSLARTTAAVGAVHTLIIAALIWTVHQLDGKLLPTATTEFPRVIESGLTILAIDGDAISTKPAAASRTTPAARKAPAATRRPRYTTARPRNPRRGADGLLGTPVLALTAPAHVPTDIPKPVSDPMAFDPYASLPRTKPVEPVAPRGVDMPGPDGDADGMGGSDVENMSLDELAREPRFTPFTQAPELMNRAEIKAFLQTRYPMWMSGRGLGGRAVLWLLIDPEGGIRKAVLLRSSGNSRLDDAALEAIERMEFRPAINKGRRVPVWVQLPIAFQPEG